MSKSSAQYFDLRLFSSKSSFVNTFISCKISQRNRADDRTCFHNRLTPGDNLHHTKAAHQHTAINALIEYGGQSARANRIVLSMVDNGKVPRRLSVIGRIVYERRLSCCVSLKNLWLQVDLSFFLTLSLMTIFNQNFLQFRACLEFFFAKLLITI